MDKWVTVFILFFPILFLCRTIHTEEVWTPEKVGDLLDNPTFIVAAQQVVNEESEVSYPIWTKETVRDLLENPSFISAAKTWQSQKDHEVSD